MPLAALLGLGLCAFQAQERHAASNPTASVEVTHHKNGITTLTFKFLHVPTDFELSDIVLSLAQDKPESPIVALPLAQVKPAPYTLSIGSDQLNGPNPSVNATIHLYRDPAQPYEMARICLWNSDPDTRLELTVHPTYRTADGKTLNIPTTPTQVSVTLENFSTVRPIAVLSSATGDKDCEAQNAKNED